MKIWQGRKDSNLCMLESKSSALTSLATPLHGSMTNVINRYMSHQTASGLIFRPPSPPGDEQPNCCICELASPEGPLPVQLHAALLQTPNSLNRSCGPAILGDQAIRWLR